MLETLGDARMGSVVLKECELTTETLAAIERAGVVSLSLAGQLLSSECFDAIAGQKQLRVLSLARCKFAVADYQQLALDTRGRIRVSFLPSAFLGVSAMKQKGGLLVTRVVDGSAASAAGVQVDDLIEKVGDQAVDDFEQLRLLISQYQIGDQLELTVKRDGESIELKARLGENEQVLF